ncbi:hypothetical protein [uncultured Anaerococcus sp.]|uniref:helix-turn-helix transcriptional regulator n=1 Tax=uncultured Anaerococcus sp. TaxID=293428 RepID=UPI00288B05FC|nr:hypothetical protein [uncultured Anaerococcus sp.]
MSDKSYFAPGEYIGDIMMEDWAEKLGLSADEYGDLLVGDLPVNSLLAERIEKVTGVSAETWLNLQKRYDQRKEG